MTTAGRLLRQVRRARAMSQRGLAAVTAEYQSSIADFERGKHDPGVDRLDRILAPLGYRIAVLPTRRPTVADAADTIYDWVRQGDNDRVFRALIQLNDDLAAEHGALRVALATASPASVGDRRVDAFIAALVEHLLNAEELPIPPWTSEPARYLDEAWVVDEFAPDEIEAITPDSFRRHNVLIDPSELTSV